ncbi:SPT16 protein, partial [Passerina amoena]|nr:SPT16 protein [Passerina amoena]
LRAALRDGSARCRQRDFAAAAAKFSTALELCSKGFALEDPLKSSPDDISRLASWIESKLVICYLKLGQPGLALHHSHRSIIQNPSHFCNHLRQAACFRCLHRYSEAARSAMVAQCLYVLAEGAAPDTSDLLQLYWQVRPGEPHQGPSQFCPLCFAATQPEVHDIIYTHRALAKLGKLEHVSSVPCSWLLVARHHPCRLQFLLGLSFKPWVGIQNHELRLEKPPKKVRRSLEAQHSQDQGAAPCASPLTSSLSLGPQDERGPCARAIEQFHHASLLSHLQRGEEQAQVMAQAMAELATVPYLQRISQEDDKLLQSLMADAMDILAGRTGERVWTKIQKV